MQSAAAVSDALFAPAGGWGGGECCQIDYKLHFCRTTPACKGKGFLWKHSFKVTHGLRKSVKRPSLPGLEPAVMGEESELVIYPLCFTHTSFNDFAVIMNCLQGREVPPFKSSPNWPSWSFMDQE